MKETMIEIESKGDTSGASPLIEEMEEDPSQTMQSPEYVPNSSRKSAAAVLSSATLLSFPTVLIVRFDSVRAVVWEMV